jgi:hypothetical protein
MCNWRVAQRFHLSYNDCLKEEAQSYKMQRLSHNHTIKRIKGNWIGHILRRNCLLKRTIEGKLEGRIEMMEKGVNNYWMTLREREDTVN